VLNRLFTSKTRVEILKLFIFNPENSFYMRQISSLIGLAIIGVQRELANLETLGILSKYRDGNRIYFKIRKDCSIYSDLKNIMLKTAGIAEVLKNRLNDADEIDFAFIFGSYAKGEENLNSDIDLMVIGNITTKKLSKILSDAKVKLAREINYFTITPKEFRLKLKEKNHFISSIAKEEKIFLIGSKDEFKEFIKSG